MMNMVKSSLFGIIIVFFLSCNENKFETVEAAVGYINNTDNGYRYTKAVNGVSYELVYRPTDFLVNQELYGRNDAKLIDSLRIKYNKYMFFNLSMSVDNHDLLSRVAQSHDKFGQMATDLAFGLDEKINMYTQEKDTLKMIDFVYPRMYGMTNSTAIMVVFPRDKKYLDDGYLNFAVQDLGFNTGEVRFKVITRAIKNEPQLRF